METSPFPYQGPLDPHEVHGRDDLLTDLAERVSARRVTALLGPRRFGKTSVLKRLAHDLAEVSTVWVDLYGAASLIDVAGRIDRAMDGAGLPFADRAREVAVSVQLNLGMVRTELARPARERPDPATRLSQLLQVLVGAAQATPTLLVIDEFSSIAHVSAAAELMRTELQHHFRDLGLILSGSEPSTMQELFSEREQPFYGQADLLTIAPLTQAAVHDIVGSGFTATGRQPGRLPALVHDFAGGHPQRTMLLADAAWSHTSAGGIGDARWADALADVRRRVDGSVRTFLAELPVGEQRVLRVMAGGGSPFGSAGDRVGLAKSSATHARAQLVARGHMTDDGTIVDPLLGDWLRRELPLP